MGISGARRKLSIPPGLNSTRVGYRAILPEVHGHLRGPYYDYDDGDEDYVDIRPGRLSCGEARRLVREHGFYDVEVRDCEGRNYAFSGFRNGHFAIIYVNSRTGVVAV